MAAKVFRFGPTNVSRHAADPRMLNVFNVAPSSVAQNAAFEAAMGAVVLVERRVTQFLKPLADPDYPLEIPQSWGGTL